MISGKSFWDRLINNNKQKIWMWIVSLIGFFVSYPALLLIYFRRIEGDYAYSEGARALADYTKEMQEAVSDVIAFNGSYIAFAFAILFGAGIFAYLNNRSKMDMLRSIPVRTRDIFIVDYVTGILLYVVPLVINLVIAIIIAFSWGYLNALNIGEMFVGQLLNLLIYLMYYSLEVICVCITGNIVLGLCGTAIVAAVPGIVESVLHDIQFTFFKTADGMFMDSKTRFAPIARCVTDEWQLKNMNSVARELLFYRTELILWTIAAIVLGLVAYIAYTKRPTEAMNKAVYSTTLQRIIKIAFGSMASIICGYVVYSSSGHDTVLFAVAGVASAFVIGMSFEVVYAGDIRSAFKSIWTTIVIGIICLLVFEVYNLDIFGYDRFLPSDNQIASYAMNMNAIAYNDAFDYTDEYKTDGSAKVEWGSNTTFYKDSMYLTNIEAIRKLVEKSYNNRLYDNTTDSNVEGFSVMYRRKNGSTVARCVYVDMSDAESLQLLNDIVGKREWREGFFQVISKKDVLKNYDVTVKYVDMVNNFTVDSDIVDLIEAWERDMEGFDYYYGSSKYPVAKLSINFGEQFGYTLPIYDDFNNLYAMIKSERRYSDRELSAVDVEEIEVTNYHSEYWDNNDAVEYTINPEVKTKIVEGERINELLRIIKPAYLYKFWNGDDRELNNYEARIYFAPDRDVNNMENDIYNFCKAVPKWLVEATANK